MDNLNYERELLSNGYKLIAGMDEAGRGPLAGAVYTAMVIMPLEEDKIIQGVNDSKKLSQKAREELFDKIINTAIAYAICPVDEKTIDDINILNATKLGMQNCLKQIKIKPDYCLVDYVPNLSLDCPNKTIVKGDEKSYSIACASILAKVARDKYITELGAKYPMYQFEKHKGYGTKLHYQMLDKYGASEIHRKSFLKKLNIEE
ncbi:MAG: ribonuclease HII [Clostridiales bacterium]|nr:ribonuclease HII [Clostridiales bacterium]